MEDDLRAEYDLKSLKVRKLGSERKEFDGKSVRLRADFSDGIPTIELENEVTQASTLERQDNKSFEPIVQTEITKERNDLYQKYREDLLKRQLSNSEKFDQSILTLSSSLLGLTLTFFRNVMPIEEAYYTRLLISAWMLLAMAIIFTVLSFPISQESIKKQMNYAKEYYLDGNEEFLKKNNIYANFNDIAGYISAAAFTFAVVLLVAFVSLNITHGEQHMSDAKIDAHKSHSKNIDGANIARMIPVPSKSDGLEKYGANIPAMQPVAKPPASPSSSGTSGNSGSESGGQPTNESSGSKQ
jgi:hypothetical protein